MPRPNRHRIVEYPLDSEVLRDNPLGDPPQRQVTVILPPEHDPSRAYPMVWLLLGFTGHPWSIVSNDPWTEGFVSRLDRLHAASAIGSMIYVVPDAFTKLGGSQYLDSSAIGRYETHLFDEILPFVEARHPTTRRGILGKSSGGYGAIVHAMRRPGVFDAVACHSGDMAFEYCYAPEFPKAQRAYERHGGVRAWFEAFTASDKKRDRRWQEALNALAMAGAYSPNPAATETLGIDLPFDLETGALREDVFERWLACDPVRLVDRHAEALRSMSLVFVDCGRRDEFSLDVGARIFSKKLTARRIVHEHQEFDDGHMGVAYRYDVSLPKIWRALE